MQEETEDDLKDRWETHRLVFESLMEKLNDPKNPNNAAMTEEATAAARTGAEQFAKDSGAPLGPIKSAGQGSFEILPRDGSGDESSALNKKIRVVTTISYRLR